MTMKDWTKQAEDMMQAWTAAQKQMRDTWLEAIQNMSGPQAGEMWTKATQAWEDSVKRALDAQAEWTRLWVESFTSSPGTSREATEWAQQGREIMNHWAEAQKSLWEGWFDMVKKIDASQIAGSWDKEGGQNLMQMWQDTTQKALEAQSEWMRRWSSLAPGSTTEKKK